MPPTNMVPAPARPQPHPRSHSHSRLHSWTGIDRTLAGIALLVPLMLLAWLIVMTVAAFA